jgi:hypothetical protein
LTGQKFVVRFLARVYSVIVVLATFYSVIVVSLPQNYKYRELVNNYYRQLEDFAAEENN